MLSRNDLFVDVAEMGIRELSLDPVQVYEVYNKLANCPDLQDVRLHFANMNNGRRATLEFVARYIGDVPMPIGSKERQFKELFDSLRQKTKLNLSLEALREYRTYIQDLDPKKFTVSCPELYIEDGRK